MSNAIQVVGIKKDGSNEELDFNALPADVRFQFSLSFKMKDLFGDYINHFMEGASEEEISDYEECVGDLSKDLGKWITENYEQITSKKEEAA